MTEEENLLLLRTVRAACPQQKLDKYTPEAWHEVLGDLPFEDCRRALATLVRAQPFVAPSEIRDQVRVIREERLARTPMPEAPLEIRDDAPAYLDWLRRTRKTIADGTYEPATLAAGELRAIGGPQ